MSTREKSVLVGRNVKVDQVGLKATGFYRAVGHAEGHPDGAELEGGATEMGPDERADQKTEQRRKEIEDLLLFFAHVVTDERGNVDAHESEQSAEVEKIRALVIRDDE